MAQIHEKVCTWLFLINGLVFFLRILKVNFFNQKVEIIKYQKIIQKGCYIFAGRCRSQFLDIKLLQNILLIANSSFNSNLSIFLFFKLITFLNKLLVTFE